MPNDIRGVSSTYAISGLERLLAMATIKDVARLAGVAPSTVSNYLRATQT